MSKNDSKIRDMIKLIDTKKKSLGERPRGSFKTNCLFKYGADSKAVNLNTIHKVEECVRLVAILVSEKNSIKEASDLLGVAFESVQYCGYAFEDWLHDFKLKSSALSWEEEKRKLDILESKLKDLRSEDAKTEDALSDIMKDIS